MANDVSPGSTGEHTFVLNGARGVMVLAAGAIRIEAQIVAIEKAVEDNPELAIDLSRALVETTCKTILKDRGSAADTKWDTPRLFRETLNCIRVTPASHSGDRSLRESLADTANGLIAVVSSLCRLRNTHGFASHGQDAYVPPLDRVQAELAARAADAVVSFLYRSHKTYAGDPRTARLRFGQEPEFDAYVDEIHPLITIFELDYRPSEVLFNVDDEAYRAQLAEFRNTGPEGGSDVEQIAESQYSVTAGGTQ